VLAQIADIVVGLRKISAGSLPARAGLLLGLGSAPGWLEDGRAFAAEHPDCPVMAVNDCIAEWPGRLDFAGSYHAAMLAEMRPGNKSLPWIACRARAGFSAPAWVVSEAPHSGVNLLLEISGLSIASSGILPVLVGKALGIRAVVLAGVELSGGHGERYLDVWRKAAAKGLFEDVYTISGGPLRDLGLVAPWPGDRFVSAPSLHESGPAGGSGALPARAGQAVPPEAA